MILASCKTPEQSVKTTPAEEKTEAAAIYATQDSLIASIERTACYGTCPIYKFSIYNSGYAVYEGKRFVDKIGKFESRVSLPIIEEIKAKARAMKYFELQDEYPKKASDFPSVKTSVVLDGKRKNINDGIGLLKDFEGYLDSVCDSLAWKLVH